MKPRLHEDYTPDRSMMSFRRSSDSKRAMDALLRLEDADEQMADLISRRAGNGDGSVCDPDDFSFNRSEAPLVGGAVLDAAIHGESSLIESTRAFWLAGAIIRECDLGSQELTEALRD